MCRVVIPRAYRVALSGLGCLQGHSTPVVATNDVRIPETQPFGR